MEFCAASLEKLYLKESEYCIPAEEIIFQLAKGLEYIHSKELVHRDLKPNNALVWMGRREVANENLHDLTTMLINALRNNQDYNYFHNQFNEEEKRQMVRTNCRVYTNHQIQAVKECNFFDAYRHCLHVIEQVQTTNCEENQAIPISVFLCPLNHIFGSIKETGKLFQYRDVDANVVTRCCRIWVGLERARAEAEAIQTDNSKRSLLQFVDAIH